MPSHALQEAIKAHEGFITAQPEQYRFILPLLRLLAEGKPVEPTHLARVAQWSLVMSEEASAYRDPSLESAKQPSPGLPCIHRLSFSP